MRIEQAKERKLRLAEAEQEFRFDLIDRFAAAKLEAIDVATIAWQATEAGAGGVSDLSVDPKHGGDNHARKVRSELGLECVADQVLYEFKLPMFDMATGSRQMRELLVQLPHEALARDFLNNSASYWKARADADWINVPNFLEHPVTKKFGANKCWPCSYYTDKVKLGNASFYRCGLRLHAGLSSVQRCAGVVVMGHVQSMPFKWR